MRPVSSRRRRGVPGTPLPANRGAFLAATIALALLAGLLRLWHIDHGLPHFTEEAFVFRRALDMWSGTGGGMDWNPHSFVYPSLTIYLHLAVQHLVHAVGPYSSPADFLLQMLVDPSSAVIASRSVGVAADLLTLIVVGLIGRRFGLLAAIAGMSIVAFAPAMVTTSRMLFTDTIMSAVAMLAVHRILVYRELGGTRHLIAAGALIGLATGAKYPAAMLMAPLALAVLRREASPDAMGRLALGAGVAVVTFTATTPHILTSWTEFVRDAVFLRDVMGGGLGKLTGTSVGYYLKALAGNLGWLGCLLFAATLIIAARRRDDRVLLLGAAWLALFTPIAVSPVEAERYVVPVVAIGAAVVGFGAAALPGVLPFIRPMLVETAAVVGVVGQVAFHGIQAAAAGRSTTQMEAGRWCETHLRDDELMLSEVNGPDLLTYGRRAQVEASALFLSAGPAFQDAYRARRPHHQVHLPLIVSGHTSVRLPTPEAPEVQVYPHVVDWNAAAYDVRLLAGVDLVATSAAVRGRFEADTVRFREQARFYRLLDFQCDTAAVFRSGAGIDGPTIVIYRMTDRAKRVVQEAGALDTLWWARTIPDEFKRRMARALDTSVLVRATVPGLPLWVQPLRSAYSERYRFSANDLAENLASLGRLNAAERLCAAGLTVLPEDVWALEVYHVVASRAEQWTSLEQTLARSIHVLSGYGPVPARQALMHGDVLVRLGEKARATEIFRSLLTEGDPATAKVARDRLEQLEPPGLE